MSEITFFDAMALLRGIDAAELEAEITRVERELAALGLLRRSLMALDGQTPPKPERQPRRKASTNENTPGASLEARIVRYLELAGHAKLETIAADLVAAPLDVHATLRRDKRFELGPLGWRLARVDDD